MQASNPFHSLGFALVFVVLGACAAGTPPTAPSASSNPANVPGQPEPISVEIVPSADNTLIETADGSLSNGSGPGIFVGLTGQGPGFARRRALLHFDLGGAIPKGSTLIDAQLSLSLNMGGPGLAVSVHRVAAPWGEGDSSTFGGRGAPSAEGDATWIHRSFDTKLWKSPGGDFASEASAEQTLADADPNVVIVSEGLLDDVRHWLDRPSDNHGWILVGADGIARFASREADAEDSRPRLTITYEPPN